jgi:predicted DNA-binding protein
VQTRKETLVQLTTELIERLDSRADAIGVSRSRLIRDLLESALAEQAEEELSAQMIAGYRRVPQSDGRDAWGDLDQWSEVMGRRSGAALAQDEEESW